MKQRIPSIDEFINEQKTNGDTVYVFFYFSADSLRNIYTDKIFDEKTWVSGFPQERLSREWIVFVKKENTVDKAKSTIDTAITKLRKNKGAQLTYQSGYVLNNEFALVDGSYSSSSIEFYFKDTINSLIDKINK